MALHPPPQLFWGCAAVVGPVPAGSSQPGGRLGNWQPTANDGAVDAGVGCYAAGEITRAAAGVPRIYCAHTGLLSVAAKAPRIKFCPRKPMRRNAALQIFSQVTLYLCRQRAYHPSCACIQPARAPPRQPPLQILLHYVIRHTPLWLATLLQHADQVRVKSIHSTNHKGLSMIPVNFFVINRAVPDVEGDQFEPGSQVSVFLLMSNF